MFPFIRWLAAVSKLSFNTLNNLNTQVVDLKFDLVKFLLQVINYRARLERGFKVI